MRLLLDSNVLISALLSPEGPPGRLARAWLDGEFELATAAEQIREIERALGYERLRPLIRPEQA